MTAYRLYDKIQQFVLRIPCYEQEFIEKMAEETGFAKKSGNALRRSRLAAAFSNTGMNIMSTQD